MFADMWDPSWSLNHTCFFLNYPCLLLLPPRGLVCPFSVQVVRLLAESFNAYVRYGAAMAVGIACAGSALPEALALLTPMLKDRVDFVRQAAFVALAMVFVQSNAVQARSLQRK